MALASTPICCIALICSIDAPCKAKTPTFIAELPLFQKPPLTISKSPQKFESQYRQVILKLIVGHLSPVVVPFNFFVFDKRLKNVVAQRFAHQFTLIS